MHTVSKYENIQRKQQETWIVLTAGTPPSWYRLNFACMPTVKTSMASFKSQQYPRHYRRLYRSDRWHIITYLRQYHGDGLNKYVAIKAHKRWLGRRGSGSEGGGGEEWAWGGVTEWSARRTRNPVARVGLSSALANCWICSRSSRLQILVHPY